MLTEQHDELAVARYEEAEPLPEYRLTVTDGPHKKVAHAALAEIG